MRPSTALFAVAAAGAVAIGACSKTENGDVVLRRPNVDVSTSPDTLHMPRLTTKTDTVTTPVVGTQKETLIVNKPVVGTKKTTVQVPVIRRP
ncbi:MAG TPA: hypothetical protein VHV78_17965 [Gemmatimonadaceae bacterium]|jgi:hypothetical protein|nr:hypothetical protein [Gemmatimonadaceae bacterium]